MKGTGRATAGYRDFITITLAEELLLLAYHAVTVAGTAAVIVATSAST